MSVTMSKPVALVLLATMAVVFVTMAFVLSRGPAETSGRAQQGAPVEPACPDCIVEIFNRVADGESVAHAVLLRYSTF